MAASGILGTSVHDVLPPFRTSDRPRDTCVPGSDWASEESVALTLYDF